MYLYVYIFKYIFIPLTSLICRTCFYKKKKKVYLIRSFSFNIIIPSIVAT